jgi:hypothetical protein
MQRKKRVDKPYYTPAERIRRVWDIENIKDLMARRGFYQANDMRREELNDLWVMEPHHQKTASMGSNWGYYVGMNDISNYYVVKHDKDRRKQLEQYTGTHPDVENTEENLGYGCMVWHPVSTPMVVLANDGKTAKGFWYVIGQESVASEGPLANCRWYMDRLAVDFAKEGDQWKIWHLVVANDLCLEAGRDAEELLSKPRPGTWPPENEFLEGDPTIRMLTHNSAMNWSDNYPFMPENYATFCDEVSYGPEGHPEYEEE